MDAGMVYQSDTGDFYPVPAGYEERYRENRRQDRFRKWINLGQKANSMASSVKVQESSVRASTWEEYLEFDRDLFMMTF